MPFRSEKQRRFMHARHPALARRWEKEGVDKSISGRLTAAIQRKGAAVGREAASRNTARAAREEWSSRSTMPTQEERDQARRDFGMIRGSGMVNQRMSAVQRNARKSGSSNVGKRMNGGTFESGPSSIAVGVPRSVERRGHVSSTYGGTSSIGRRWNTDVEKALIPTDQLNAGKQAIQNVAGGAAKKVKPLQNQVQQGFQAQRAGYPGAVQGAAGRAGVMAGQATATPMRQAGTAATAGALGGMGTMNVLQPDPNLVAPPSDQFRGGVGKGFGRLEGVLKAVVPSSKSERADLNRQGREMARTRHGAVMERTKLHGPRPRHYDPEMTRQRRVGQAQAGTAIGGAGALAVGGRRIVRDSKRVKRAAKVTPRSGALVGAGLAALGTTEGLRRYGNDPRSRRWT